MTSGAESDAVHDAADWLARLEIEVPLLLTRERRAALERVTRDYDHYVAALAHYVDTGDMMPASRMVRGLRVYWDGAGRYEEGRAWIARALERPEAQARTPARAMLLDHAGCLALGAGDSGAACAAFRECLDIRRQVGPEALLPVTLSHLGIGLRAAGDLAGARATFQECVRLCEETGEEIILFGALFWLARVAVDEGELDEARALVDRSEAVWRGHPERAPWQEGSAAMVRAVIAAMRGSRVEAERLFEGGVALMRERGRPYEELPAREREWYEAPIRASNPV